MRAAIALTLLIACRGSGDDAPPDANGGRCSVVCPAGDVANCGFDGLMCSCSSTPIACELDSCDGRSDAVPFCSEAGLCTVSAPWCEYNGQCFCQGAGPMPIECRTETCEAG